MKKHILLLLTAASLVICSSVAYKPAVFNANSWSMGIGKKLLLASWKNHKIGDTAIIEKKKIKATDILYVTQYWCGYDGRHSSVTLTVKNEKGDILQQFTNRNENLFLRGQIALKNILTSAKFAKGQVFGIYCSVTKKGEKAGQSAMIAKLLIK